MEEYKKIPLPILPRADVWDVYRNRADNNYITAGTEALRQSENFSQRRNDILDFMLSLYNEQLPIFSPSGTYQPAGGNEDISIKEDYLARYPMLSMSRGIAGSFNGLGGPEENLRALLNIPDRPESPIYNLISSVFTIRMVPSGMSADDARAATGSPYSFVGNNTSIYEFFQLAVHDISYQTVEEGKEKATGLSLEVNGKPIEMFTNMATVKAYAEVRSFQQKLIKFSNEAENFYVIDHSDLDYKQDNTTLEHAEFYRYRMSYIFPGFTLRFGEEAYRNYVESLIFQYTPAHIRPYVYWLEFDQLRDFEQYYYALKAVVTTDSTGDGEMEKAEALGLFLYGLYVASPVYQPNS
jgi:hypothetical protein